MKILRKKTKKKICLEGIMCWCGAFDRAADSNGNLCLARYQLRQTFL